MRQTISVTVLFPLSKLKLKIGPGDNAPTFSSPSSSIQQVLGLRHSGSLGPNATGITQCGCKWEKATSPWSLQNDSYEMRKHYMNSSKALCPTIYLKCFSDYNDYPKKNKWNWVGLCLETKPHAEHVNREDFLSVRERTSRATDRVLTAT